jgi:hypothetical protein
MLVEIVGDDGLSESVAVQTVDSFVTVSDMDVSPTEKSIARDS